MFSNVLKFYVSFENSPRKPAKNAQKSHSLAHLYIFWYFWATPSTTRENIPTAARRERINLRLKRHKKAIRWTSRFCSSPTM